MEGDWRIVETETGRKEDGAIGRKKGRRVGELREEREERKVVGIGEKWFVARSEFALEGVKMVEKGRERKFENGEKIENKNGGNKSKVCERREGKEGVSGG